jgi:uncharacterized protein involved in exopolysaccharide biosynthesis
MIYAQRDERVKEIADLECTVNDLEEDQDEAAQSRDQLVQDLADVEKQIIAKEKQLRDLVPKLTTIKGKEAKVKKKYLPYLTHLIAVSMKHREKSPVFGLNKADKFSSRVKQNETRQLLRKSNKSNNS